MRPQDGGPNQMTSKSQSGSCRHFPTLDVVEQMLDASAAVGQTRMLPTIADWLQRTRGVALPSSWISVLLHRDGFRYKPTRDSPRHQANPALQQAATDPLEGLRQAAGAGRIEAWMRPDSPRCCPPAIAGPPGKRAMVRRQDNKGRRINVLGAVPGRTRTGVDITVGEVRCRHLWSFVQPLMNGGRMIRRLRALRPRRRRA
jgi:Winged helix-turn helix